ncbi:MAG: hypothetical protein OXC48_01015, partial [Endozoicomonadaceae bacterium]|nr:hypothetical protein [Endozoicomonadaceae bacterium]
APFRAFPNPDGKIVRPGGCPDIDLKINYSSGSTANPDFLGVGWSWNLTHFNSHANQLATSTGQNFHLQKEAAGQWKPLYHKLKDIDIHDDKNNNLIITYANGLRETVNNEGYETRLEQQDGNAVNFFYKPGTHLLTGITDNQHHRIKIIHNKNYITVISQGTEGQPVKVCINNSNHHISAVTLPFQSKTNIPGLHIRYKGHLIAAIDYPTGLKKIFDYNCTNAIRMVATDTHLLMSLCAVSAATVFVHMAQPPLIIHYGYSEINADSHNYLGFNAGLASITDYSGRDRLFEVPADYTYQTLEDNQLIKEIRTYNKYHLLINDKKISDRTGHILSEVNNFYCRTDKTNGCAHTSFKDLPTTYSLPLKTITKVWGDSNGQPDISTVTNAYDQYGKTIYSKDNYGRVTKVTYCPVKGDTACPAMPEGWMFSTLTQSVTTYPSGKTINIPHAITLPVTTYNYYRRKLNRNNTGYILVIDHQIYQSGHAQIISKRYYYNDYHDALTYGLVRKTILKKRDNNLLSTAALIRHYYYTKDHDNYSKTSYNAIELEDGKLQRFPSVTTSLFTNQVLKQTDISGTRISRYHYDNYGRLIQKDIAMHSSVTGCIHYKYTVSPELNQISVTLIKGLQHKIIFDSIGRKLQEWSKTIDAIGKAEAGRWLLKKQFGYNRYGHLMKVYSYTTNELKKIDTLTTTYKYDDMGVITQVILPDGQHIFKLYHDAERCMISYRMSRHAKRSAIEIVYYNTLNKPIKQITLPAFHRSLSAVKNLCAVNKWQQGARIFKITYDGFGRIISVTDPADRTITRVYNSLGEITVIKDSSGHELHYIYDLTGHRIKVYKQYRLSSKYGSWLMYAAHYNPAGQLLWQQGASCQHTTYTYTVDGHPSTITTPAGHVISFKYNPSGLPVTQYINGQLQMQIDYDPVTALPIKKSDITGTRRYFYSNDGMLQKEVHVGKNGYPDYRLQWFYDLNRRLIAVTDINGNKTVTQYDSLGRIAALYYNKLHGQRQLLTSLAYDDFSRITAIHYGSGMQRIINYDNYGRQYQVTDTLDKKLLFQWNYTYDVVNNIIQIQQQGSSKETGLLNYQYDMQNNLIAMTCRGSAGLPLCPRDTAFTGSGLSNAPVIIRQRYHFNPLNRLTEAKEVLQNSSEAATLSKVISYHYYKNMPLRLQHINTSWNNHLPVSKDFIYDTAGNMTVDGQGNQIVFNLFNQITAVITTQGKYSHYNYDGSGKEVMEKTPFSIHHFFYRGHYLINESIQTSDSQKIHTAGYQSIARTMDGTIDQYYEKNYKGDITGVLTQKKPGGQYTLHRYNIYSPYGMSWHHPEPAELLYKQLLTGFNGERSDSVTNWQFLGAGHRTYNPQQHYFVSEDLAGDGYRFAANNPIMNIDSDGNMPRSMKQGLRIINYVTTLGFGAIHK